MTGIFLGVKLTSQELYIGVEKGVIRARAVKRRAGGERYNVELLKKLQGSPWRPVPGAPRDGGEAPAARFPIERVSDEAPL